MKKNWERAELARCLLLALLISSALSVTGEVPKKARDLYGLLRAELLGIGPLSLLAFGAVFLLAHSLGRLWRRGRGGPAMWPLCSFPFLPV